MITHSKLVKALVKDGAEILREMTHLDAHMLHMAVGVSGEAGELLDAIKKVAIYRRAIDRENVIEELGDLEFFMEGLRQGFGITRKETIKANIKKLSVRYAAGKYSNEQAAIRADKSK